MRYLTRPTQVEAPGTPELNDWQGGPLLPTLTVDGAKEVNTKLLDRHGNPIYRVQAPIGFGRDAEH